ncbi:uncharacterized protein AMSG_02916 [Thecamonas trahens ATCC 50062]|uniref:Uncharacterized protein n=1 Tax=Thecamonas trahens ATCC 50062 TaxID=461836 RepID=A0A0L0D290_THETB|nr:hypothetical protein AMSG_02916 [Thecamonas trahens ATCC 50062]KNC46459.1 hypothetical protein AMSG_02916 [Thecamonas trahens ATCC 50062]|eukprot:XP_013760750.1 hypothetical protein AMSG_02916 [Thecamonas trahens ATCC 50062]
MAGGVVAGSMAGLVLGACEGTSERSIELALYMLARAMDALVQRMLPPLPPLASLIGTVAVFMALQTIIMWAFCYSPELLPARYLRFMASIASRQRRMIAHIRRMMRISQRGRATPHGPDDL